MVPKVIGQTVKAQEIKSQRRGSWDRESFLTESGREKIAEDILRWAEEKGLSIDWGTGYKTGSFMVKLEENGTTLFTVKTKDRIAVYYGSIAEEPPFDKTEKLHELGRKINDIGDISISDEDIQPDKYPSFPISEVEDDMERFLETMEWAAGEVKEKSI